MVVAPAKGTNGVVIHGPHALGVRSRDRLLVTGVDARDEPAYYALTVDVFAAERLARPQADP